MVNAFYFETHDNAQVVSEDDGILKTQRLLGITKDYFILMDGGRGVVRKQILCSILFRAINHDSLTKCHQYYVSSI
jgi:hypothetical protein